MHSPFLLAAIGAILTLTFPSAGLALSGHLEVEKGEFRLQLDDGRVLVREELVGTRIVMQSDGQDIQVLIDAIEQEDNVPGGPVMLYRLLIEEPVQRTFQSACLPDIRGRQLGLPIHKETGVDFTCTSGAEGKCILMGYRPWDERMDVPMRDLHTACVHMMRADYGGDDHPTTRDGTLIEINDRFGIQKPGTADPMPFEAAWGTRGALCVAHPRIGQNVTLEDLAKVYPKLRGRLGSEACTEESMRSHPEALIFNRSALTHR